jgi:hypothetical protein
MLSRAKHLVREQSSVNNSYLVSHVLSTRISYYLKLTTYPNTSKSPMN